MSTIQQARLGKTIRQVIVWSFLALSTVLILQLVVWSFSFRWHFPSLLPQSLTLRAWRLIAAPRSNVLEVIGTSVLVSLMVTVLNVAIALPATLYIHTLRKEAKLLANICVLLPLLVPPLSVITGAYQAMVRIGLTDSMVGVIIVHLLPTLPYMIVILQAVMSNIDFNYFATASTLGAAGRVVFLRVFLPLILPGLITGSFFVFLISWSQYLPTLIVGGGRVMTIPILLFAYAASGDLTLMAMFSVLLVAPTLILLSVNARYITGKAYHAQENGI